MLSDWKIFFSIELQQQYITPSHSTTLLHLQQYIWLYPRRIRRVPGMACSKTSSKSSRHCTHSVNYPNCQPEPRRPPHWSSIAVASTAAKRPPNIANDPEVPTIVECAGKQPRKLTAKSQKLPINWVWFI